MRWKRVLLTMLILTSMMVAGLGRAYAQETPTDAQFIQQATIQYNIPADQLQVAERVELDFPLTGVLLYTAKVRDSATGRAYLVALDAQHRPADVKAATDAEESANRAVNGKLTPRLKARKDRMGPQDKVPVAIWLNTTMPAMNRSQPLTDQLAALQQFITPKQKKVRDGLASKNVQAKLSKYAPLVFAQLTPEQIDFVTQYVEVQLLFGPEDYRLASDGGATTAGAPTVWSAGNTGAGTSSRPVILEPGGVSDQNPYLNNTTHSVVFWCATVTSLCPNGKNIQDHASQMAGIVGSTNSNARGIASSSQVILSANTQQFDDAKMIEAFEWARANNGDPTVISWSATCGGSQTVMSRYLDWAVRNLFATVVVAAGNRDSICPDPIGDEMVGGPAGAWNVITVGSLNDAGTGFWSDDSMSSFSDWRNPSFAPGMEKPEVVAVGENIYTTSSSAVNDWLTPSGVSGTSFAAPQVAGQIALMLNRKPGQNVWPETNKAAVLASAFHDIEPGQDRDGVGAVMMNVSDDTYHLNRFINDQTSTGAPLTAASFPRNHNGVMSLQAGERVRVAIAWDSNSNGTSSDVLGADLDLCVRHPNGTILACSTSYQNTWELVEFTAPITGAYDIVVDRAGSDANWPGTYLGIAWGIRSIPNICSDAISLPGTGSSQMLDTTTGTNYFQNYAGWTPNQSGREKVIKLQLAATQDIWFSDTNQNLDLHILQFPSCTADPIQPTVLASGVDSASVTAAPPGTYYLVVDGANGAVGTTTVTVGDRPVPSAPANLNATAGDKQVSLTWNTVTGATSYNVKRATASSGPYTTVSGAGSVTGSAFIDTNVSNGTTYYYVVSAVNTGGESPNSNQVSATPNVTSVPIKAMTFEAASLTDANTGADSTTAGVTRITTNPIKGTASAQAQTTTATTAYLQEDFTATDNLYTSFYLRVPAIPANNTRVAVIMNGTTVQGEVMLMSTGRLRLRFAGTTIGADSVVLAANTVYRIGLVQKRGTGTNATVQAFLATGDATFSATPFAQTTTGALTAQANRFRIGVTNGVVSNVIIDDVKLDAGVMPTP